MLASGFQWTFLEMALNPRPLLPVRNGTNLLVSVDAVTYVRLLYAAYKDCQAKIKSGERRSPDFIFI
jgi:hypothetical protein